MHAGPAPSGRRALRSLSGIEPIFASLGGYDRHRQLWASMGSAGRRRVPAGAPGRPTRACSLVPMRRRLPGTTVPRTVGPVSMRRGRRPPRAVRARRLAVAPVVVRLRAPDDQEPERCGGPGPGDLPSGLPGLRRVPGGHEPQGLALPDPDEQLHQHLPEAATRAADRGGSRRSRGLVPLRQARREEHGGVGRGPGPRPAARHGR